MTEEPTPITEAALEGELQILLEEVAIVEAQLEDVRTRYQAAMDAEHEAGVRHRELAAISNVMLLAMREADPAPGVIQAAIFAPQDAFARAAHPDVAAAVGRTDSAFEETRVAAARTNTLKKALDWLEKQKLPGLRIAAHDKEQQLLTHRAKAAEALERRDTTLKEGLAAFRKKLRAGR